jgi:hypothetical protein
VSIYTGSFPITFPYATLIQFVITATDDVTNVTFLLSTNYTNNKQLVGPAIRLRYERAGVRISAG